MKRKLIICSAVIAFMISPNGALAAEPKFPGVGAPENKFLGYWKDYSKHVMKSAPDKVKNGTDQQKADYVTGKIGDQADKVGIKPNTSLWGRIKGIPADGPRSRGSCGDMTNILQAAFEGAGIKKIVTIEANKTGVLWGNRSYNFLDVNRDHGTLGVPNDKGRVKMYDLWEHGKDKGTFRGMATSRWNGMELKNWGRDLQKDGYGDFDLASASDKDKEKDLSKADDFANGFPQKLDKARQEAMTKARGMEGAIRAAVAEAQAAIEAVKAAEAAANGAKSAADGLKGGPEQLRGDVAAAKEACQKVVSAEVVEATKARAAAAAANVGDISSRASKFAEKACEVARRVHQVSDIEIKRNLVSEAQALANYAASLAEPAANALAQAEKEARLASQQNANREAARRKGEAVQSAISSFEQRLNGVEEKINSAQSAIDKVPKLDKAKKSAKDAKRAKDNALRILSHYQAFPDVKALMGQISAIKLPSVEGLDGKKKAASQSVDDARTAVSDVRRKLASWKEELSACTGMVSTDALAQEAQDAAEAAGLYLSSIQSAVKRANACASLEGAPESTWTAGETSTELVSSGDDEDDGDAGPAGGCDDPRREPVKLTDGTVVCGPCRFGFTEDAWGNCSTPAEIASTFNCPDPTMEKVFKPETGQVLCYCRQGRWDESQRRCVVVAQHQMDPMVPALIFGLSAIIQHQIRQHHTHRPHSRPPPRSGSSCPGGSCPP